MTKVSKLVSLDEKVELKSVVSSDLDFKKIFKEFRVSPLEEIKPPKIVLNQSVFGENRMIATLGNFSLISGKAKVGKSLLMTLLTAVFISNNEIQGLSNRLPNNKKNVVYFDTEQGKWHVQKLVKRICRLTGIKNPNNLDVIYLRKFTALERLKIIEEYIHSNDNLGVVIIDGVKDLVTSINDEDQACNISSKLLKWSEEKDLHISVVLHQNKGDRNARGHLGTELVNKCETYLTVDISEGDNSISIVTPESCRNRPPEPFAFERIDDLPSSVQNLEIRTSTRKKSFDIANIEDFKKIELINSVYTKGHQELSYKDLMWYIKKEFEVKFSKKLSDHKCRDLINEFKDKDWLIQKKIKGPYKQASHHKEIE